MIQNSNSKQRWIWFVCACFVLPLAGLLFSLLSGYLPSLFPISSDDRGWYVFVLAALMIFIIGLGAYLSHRSSSSPQQPPSLGGSSQVPEASTHAANLQSQPASSRPKYVFHEKVGQVIDRVEGKSAKRSWRSAQTRRWSARA